MFDEVDMYDRSVNMVNYSEENENSRIFETG